MVKKIWNEINGEKEEKKKEELRREKESGKEIRNVSNSDQKIEERIFENVKKKSVYFLCC